MYFINKKGKAGTDLTSIYLESALFWLAWSFMSSYTTKQLKIYGEKTGIRRTLNSKTRNTHFLAEDSEETGDP